MEEQESVLQGIALADGAGDIDASIGYGTAGFYGDALYDDRGRTSFLKECVSVVRKCPEYARYRNFLLENLNMDKCSIFAGLSEEEVKEAGLEIHHAPLALYDIAELVLGKMHYDNERITTFSVANRVMALHWMGMVGLVPLTATLHEAVHSGQLIVDPRTIFGNWMSLLDTHREGMTEHLAAKINAMVACWNSGDIQQMNEVVLTVAPQRWTLDAPTARSIMEKPEDIYEAE